MGNAEFWAGSFGNSYLERNQVDWRARVPFWRLILHLTRPNSVFEIGANAGWNLRAIREASPGTHVAGIDVNAKASRAARNDGIQVYDREATVMRTNDRTFDLVFTAGVLIHVEPEKLAEVMQAAAVRSNRYVLAVEYEAQTEEEVEYRGHAGKLWRRPYGALYEEMGLRMVAEGDAQGFDRCRYWLLTKGTQ